MPKWRMGPPPRSFAADAHDCIMVRVLGPTGYKVVARLIAPERGLPLIVIPIAPNVLSCSKLSRCGLATAELVGKGWCDGPTLTASVRASGKRGAGRDEETGSQIEQRN